MTSSALSTTPSTARVPGAARTPVRLELTSRGRLVLGVLTFLGALVVAFVLVLGTDIPSALAGADRDTVTVTVQEGDTLSEYAERYAGGDVSPREYVEQVQQLNDLSSPRITAGTELDLPGKGSAVR